MSRIWLSEVNSNKFIPKYPKTQGESTGLKDSLNTFLNIFTLCSLYKFPQLTKKIKLYQNLQVENAPEVVTCS